MRRLGITVLFLLAFIFLPIIFPNAFVLFSLNFEPEVFTIDSLKSKSSDFVVSFNPVSSLNGEESQPYAIRRFKICDEYDDYGNCSKSVPDLCPYISLSPKNEESTEIGFPLRAYIPSYATGELNAPGDLTDDWTLILTSPCFEGECPVGYNRNINGDPLPQNLKGQNFKCALNVEWNGPIFPVYKLSNTAYAASGSNVMVEAVFTGAVENKINPVIIVPGIAGTELYNENDLIWLDLSQTFGDVNDQFLNVLNLNEQGESLINISLGNVIKRIQALSVFDVNIFEDLSLDLQSKNNYQENENLFFFPYDWRSDLRDTKELLSQKIDEIKTQTGADKVDIIAHSMGGVLVKNYLNSYGKDNVDKLIFVGTPHLGAPKVAKILLEGDRFGVPWLENERIKEIAKNSPAVHELLPSPKYFSEYQGYLRNFFVVSLNPMLNYEETKSFFLDKTLANSTMFQIAKDFQNQNLQDLDLSGLNVYNIAGCKTATQTAYSLNSNNNIGQIGYSSGDGTVPLPSSDYINISSQNKFYFKNGEHAELPSSNGARDLILDILQNKSIGTYENISNSSSTCVFKGKNLSWHSPVEVHIYDSNGRHIGPVENGIEYGIPGVDYEIINHEKFVFLPTDNSQEYQIVAIGEEEGSFDLKISEIDNGLYGASAVFNDVAISQGDTINFIVNNIQENNSIGLENKDGFFEVEADVVLNGDGVLDLVPPETEIETSWVNNKQSRWLVSKKQFKIELSATDDSSGILETVYSLDGGENFEIYQTPIITDKKIDKILYYSVDKAGNNEEIQEFDVQKNKICKFSDKKCFKWYKKHIIIKKVYKKINFKNETIMKKFINPKFKIKSHVK